MVKKYAGHLYETHQDWHPAIITKSAVWIDNIVYLPAWLSEHCPDADADYDAYVYAGDNLMDVNHRTIYFFRDPEVAVLFILRWG